MRPLILSLVALTGLALLTGCASQRPEPAPLPNVLLITIDTLRADRLGRGLTPTLDRLADGGVSFSNARTAVPLTLPSHATILSGLLPPHHGVRLNGTGHFAGHPTLATALHARGYRTAAAVGAFVLARQFGLDGGFDVYDDVVPRDPNASTALEAERKATAVTDAALGLITRTSPSRPLFLWVHYYDPHAPYEPPARFLAQANESAYDGEVAYVDSEVGRLLAAIARLEGDTVIVVAGDHGESLGEHGEDTHGMLLYDGALRVPLTIASSAGGPRRDGVSRASGSARAALARRLRREVRPDNASLADVAPTVLALLGVPPPAPMDGADLLADRRADRELYAETLYPRLAGWSPLAALVSGEWKFVRGGRPQLFQVRSDPGERHDMTSERAAIAAGMDARLAATTAGAREATASLSSEARERLRSLGYLAASPSSVVPEGAPDPADRIDDWRAFEAASALFAEGSRGAKAGSRRTAIQHLEQLARRNPQAQAFHTAWARVLGQAGRHAESLRAYREATVRWPGDAMLLHDLAVAARDAGEPAEGLRAEQAALTVDPNNAAAFNGLGLLHADAGRAAEAAEAFERAVSLDRTDPSIWSNLGNARRAQGNLPAARQAYQAALAVDATWPDAANGVGVLEVQAGRAAEGIRWFEKALGRAPDFVEARLNLGIACQEAGQTGRARAEYQAVLRAPARFARERDAARTLLEGLSR